MTLATAIGFTFAGFPVEATGWRPVLLVGAWGARRTQRAQALIL